jgi:hypothetical protein
MIAFINVDIISALLTGLCALSPEQRAAPIFARLPALFELIVERPAGRAGGLPLFRFFDMDVGYRILES